MSKSADHNRSRRWELHTRRQHQLTAAVEQEMRNMARMRDAYALPNVAFDILFGQVSVPPPSAPSLPCREEAQP